MALTVEAWVYVPNYPGNDVVLIGKDDANSARQHEFGRLGNFPGSGDFGSRDSRRISNLEWYSSVHHCRSGITQMVMTYDGSALRLTVNGSPDGVWR